MKKLLLLFAFVFSISQIGQAQVVYTLNSCTYNVIPGAGTPLPNCDDCMSGMVPIGFNFDFYGTVYTQCDISSNGFLTFNAGMPNGCCSGQFLPSAPWPTMIAWSWDDMYTVGATVNYFTTGIAPNQIFVVNYNNVGYCCSSSNQATVQIQLYESTNEIRIVSTNNNHIGRTATMGIYSGATALPVPGRNSQSWASGANECQSFFPGPPNDICANAFPILPGLTSGSTIGGNADVEVACGTAANSAAAGVWYTYTPGCSGNITASLCSGTSYDSQLRVFSGACGSLACVSGNNDFCATQSEVTWLGTGGVTYYILVHGAGAATGLFDLTLTQTDAVAPVPDVSSLPDVTGACSASITVIPTATDNCSGSLIGTTSDSLNYNTPGTFPVTWTYTDLTGNVTTQVQNVIVSDVLAPTAAVMNDTTVSNDLGICGAVVNYQEPACPVPGYSYTDQAIDNAELDNGYFITAAFPDYIADDFIIPAGDCPVIDQITANIWESVPGGSMVSMVVNIHSDAGGIPGPIVSTQTLTAANWSGVVGGSAFGYTVSSYTFNLITPVTLCGGGTGATYWLSLYDDMAGATNVAWSIIQPIYNNPAQQSAFGTPTGPWSTNGDDFVFGIYGPPVPGTVADNCPTCPTITQTAGLPSGSLFPVGTTTNTWTIVDGAGNTTIRTFDLTVVDDEDPTNVDSVIVYDITSPNTPMLLVDDATTIDSVMVTVIPTTLNSGDIASVCIDIDHATDGDMYISLISPAGTVLPLSYSNGGTGDDYIETCFDMTATTPITSGSAPFIGSYIPEGLGGFDVFNGEDPNGYWKLSVADSASPEYGVLYDFTIHFNFEYDTIIPAVYVECQTITAPVANDNCDGVVSGVTSDPTSYTTDGTYLVTWTFTDGVGNALVQTQEVVVDDVTPPVPDVALLYVSGTCSLTVSTVPTATDNCGGTINGTTLNALTFNAAGTYTVTWTYDDGNGNITTQLQTVVVTDNVDPVPSVAFLPNVVGNCTVTVSTAPTATDNCAGTITGTTTDALTYNLEGTYLITWEFNDLNGNIFTQGQTVTVNPCLGLEDESGQWTALIYPNPSSGIFTLSLSEMPTANTEMKLVNALGQVIYSGMMTNQVQQFDFSHLASATYYILITSNSGQISKPIIIRHND